jgi:50S ribosomal protein uL3
MGRKVGMTQVFTESGESVPVTVIEVEPNVVTQVRTASKDGYEAVQLGYREVKRLNKPEAGHLRSSVKLRHLREVKLADGDAPSVGDTIDVALFAKGERVDVTGVSKGKGFASSATILPAAPRLTVSRTGIGRRARLGPARPLGTCSRGCACRAIWATNARPF